MENFTQRLTLKKHRTTYSIFQKTVRKHAIESGNEKLWSYFILATLRWFTPPKKLLSYPDCVLCPLKASDTLNHFLECPGLQKEHSYCYQALLQALRDKDISYPDYDRMDADKSIHIDFLSNSLPKSSNNHLKYWNINKAMRNIVLNCSKYDKASAIAGFIPYSIMRMLKYLRPNTSTQDIQEIKLAILESCASRYNSYRRKRNIILSQITSTLLTNNDIIINKNIKDNNNNKLNNNKTITIKNTTMEIRANKLLTIIKK